MKQLIINMFTIGLAVFCVPHANAQGWSQIDDFPSSARDDGTSFTIGSSTYCGTGLEVGWNPTNDFYALDMLTDSWTSISSLPTNEARQYACGFASQQYGFIFGGLNSSGYLNDLWRYDPFNDSWSEVSPLPSAGRSGSSCFVIGDTAYILGGKTQTTSSISEVWTYCFSTDSWAQKNPLPDSLWRASAVSYSDKGYIVFGVNTRGNYNRRLYEFSPLTDSWTSLASFPGVGRIYSGISVLDDQLVIVAGRDSLGNSYNDMWNYSPQSNSWNLSVNLPADQRRGGMCFASNSAIYYSTGINLFDQRLTETWKYDLFLDVNKASFTDVELFPNPTSSSFRVINDDSDAIMEYEITSHNGTVIQSGTISMNELISVEDLTKGYYFVMIQSESRKIVKKLVVI